MSRVYRKRNPNNWLMPAHAGLKAGNSHPCDTREARNLLMKDRRGWLPSGAAMVFAVAEHDPPFLSQVAAVESSEYLAKFSNGLPTVWSPDSATHSVCPPAVLPLLGPCLPDRKLCTPHHALVEATGPGVCHIVLPANLEWGAAIPNPSNRPVAIQNARGIACWNWQTLGPEGCNGPAGNQFGAGALITRTKDGRTRFSIEDRTGNFRDNEGFFEFDVRLQ